MQDFFHPQYVKHKQREKPPFVPLTSSLAVTSQALHQTWIRQGKADSPAKQGWNQTDFHEFSWEDRNIHYQWNFIAGKIHVSDLLESMIFSIIPMGHPLEIRGICREYCCIFWGGLGCLCKSKWVWFGEIAMFGSFIAYSGEHHRLCCNFNVVLVLGWKRRCHTGVSHSNIFEKGGPWTIQKIATHLT